MLKVLPGFPAGSSATRAQRTMSGSLQPEDITPLRSGTSLSEAHHHERCWACGSRRHGGLQLRFIQGNDHSVGSQFDCAEFYAGYPGIIHGGVISAVLDAAMTHCLFARGEDALTTELKVRFRSPVAVGTPGKVRATLVRTRGQFIEVAAEFWQDGKLCAVSRGKFIRSQGNLNPLAPYPTA